jgi:hypothetical protein
MNEQDLDPDSRAAQAFRRAIGDLEVPLAVDPASARDHVRRRRLAGLIATAVVLLAVCVSLPQVMGGSAPTAVPVVGGPAQSGDDWRTEHYRDITFEVPASWGYAYEPTHDCAKVPKRYVALGERPIQTMQGCSIEDGRSLRSEHAAVRVIGPYGPKVTPGEEQTRGWWISTVMVGDLALRAVSRDRDVVDRILASVRTVTASSSGLCTPHHSLERDSGERPARPFDVTAVREVDSITVCQYTPVEPGYDADTGLSGQVVLVGEQAARLLSSVQQSPPNPAGPCRRSPAEGDQAAYLAVVLYLRTGAETHQLYLSVPSCSDKERRPTGGFDDGTTVRQVTRQSCRAVTVPPIRVETGGRQLFDACEG